MSDPGSLRVAVYASHPHYLRHLRPVGAALRARGVDAAEWSWAGDVAPVMTNADAQRQDVVVVASHRDATDGRFHGKRVVYVEHGAGQTYIGAREVGYAGSPFLAHVALFLCPNEFVAGRWRRTYPATAVEVVGSPALDVHSGPESGSRRSGDASSFTRPGRGVVAWTWHWRCPVVPETMPALPHYEPVLPAVIGALRASGVAVVGTAHPKAYGPTRALWKALGVPYEPDPDEIIRSAGLVVADNTSLLYEAAACGVPVLCLNAPWYRREVEHGLRFWSEIPGLQCDDPERLDDAIRAALHDDERAASLRAAATGRVYGDTLDGNAAARAAEVIETVVLQR